MSLILAGSRPVELANEKQNAIQVSRADGLLSVDMKTLRTGRENFGHLVGLGGSVATSSERAPLAGAFDRVFAAKI